MPKSAIPMGSEFGPNQVDLVRVLELAQQHEGDDEAFTNAIATEYKHPTKTAKNTILSMRKYLLIDDGDRLTEVGHRLLTLQSQSIELYAAFARHILLNLRGIEVVNAIDTLIKSGERPTQLSIAEMLHAQGVYVPPSSTHISKLCGWLRLAGVFSRWQIQCKNTPDGKVSLEDIAKEVGLSIQLKSNVILVVTTGQFSRDALIYADDVMQATHLNIVTLDKGDLNTLTQSPLTIVEILNKKARRVMELKTLPGI